MFGAELYGLSLPLDLRVRLAIYRLRLGEEEEAFVSDSLPITAYLQRSGFKLTRSIDRGI